MSLLDNEIIIPETDVILQQFPKLYDKHSKTTDMLGRELNVGDFVIFAISYPSSAADIRIGVIEKITEKQVNIKYYLKYGKDLITKYRRTEKWRIIKISEESAIDILFKE